MGHPIYHLDLRVERCRARVSLNDVPVATLEANGDQPEWFAPPINPYLVGADNELAVEIYPAVTPEGEPIELSEARVELAVMRVEKGRAVAPGEGDRVMEWTSEAELAERIDQAREDEEELEIPQTFVMIFDNEAVDFAAELRDAPPFDDEQALRDYAVVLRDLVGARDAGGLAAEMEPKVQAYARAYDDSADLIRDSLVSVLRDQILPAGPVTGFEAADVQLESHAGGRVWEMRQPDGRPLVASDPDPDGSTYQIPIYVSLRDGALKVVR